MNKQLANKAACAKHQAKVLKVGGKSKYLELQKLIIAKILLRVDGKHLIDAG